MCCSCEKPNSLFCFNWVICCFYKISFDHSMDYINKYPVATTAQNRDFLTCAVFGINTSITIANVWLYFMVILQIHANTTATEHKKDGFKCNNILKTSTFSFLFCETGLKVNIFVSYMWCNIFKVVKIYIMDFFGYWYHAVL
jgi:hypothetical protein